MTASPKYTFIIPTYRRPDMIGECLASLCALDYERDRIEVLVIDNGGENATIAEARPYIDRLALRYLVNRQNRGYGYSVNRGIVEARGDRMVLLNDDARPDPSMLRECDAVMDADPTIGAACPKILLATNDPAAPRVINNVGNELGPRWEPHDRGYGEPDDGRYDEPSDGWGWCGGGVLLRRLLPLQEQAEGGEIILSAAAREAVGAPLNAEPAAPRQSHRRDLPPMFRFVALRDGATDLGGVVL